MVVFDVFIYDLVREVDWFFRRLFFLLIFDISWWVDVKF